MVLTKAPDRTKTTQCPSDTSSTPWSCGATWQTKSSTDRDAEDQSVVRVWMADIGPRPFRPRTWDRVKAGQLRDLPPLRGEVDPIGPGAVARAADRSRRSPRFPGLLG